MRTFVLSFITLFAFLANAPAQDFSGLKFCVNPGHGGHDSDDRFIPETGFWESEGNLTKGLYLRDILQGWGAEVIMSRTTNTTEDDLPLSQIAEIANSNNVDLLHSIHSNASDQKHNHPLMLFRGYTNDPVFPEAKEMSRIMFDQLLAGHKWCVYTSDRHDIAGDWSFYNWGTSGLGVLRPLNMPGVLSEGSHHDYAIESWRLQNHDYRRHEAWIFAKSYIEHYGTEAFSLGEIVGIVRDPWQITDYFYTQGSGDKFVPINQVDITITPGPHYTTSDTMNNGFFMIDSLPPGEYQVVYEHEDYFTDSVTVTVTANETAFADMMLTYDTTQVPLITDYSPAPTVDSVLSMQPVTIAFTESMDSAAVVNALQITPEAEGVVHWENDYKHMIFQPTQPYARATDYVLTLNETATQKWGVPLSEPFSVSFTSTYRNKYYLLGTYPANDQEVWPQLQFQLLFDKPLDDKSLIGRVAVTNQSNDTLLMASPKVRDTDGYGIYQFAPATPLTPGENYTLHLSGRISDEQGHILVDDRKIAFSVAPEPEPTGQVLYHFEDQVAWDDPDNHAETVGTDPNRTYSLVYQKPVYEGTYSLRMDYTFTQANAQAVLQPPGQKPVTGSELLLGMWLYGDNSGNEVVLQLADGNGATQDFTMDTLNWGGWKFSYIMQTDISLESPVYLNTIRIVRTEDGLSAGSLNFDQIMTANIFPTGVERPSAKRPIEVFPNPAHSQVQVRWSGQSGHWQFQLYDRVGRLLLQHQVAGEAVSVPLNDLAPGIYFYKTGSETKSWQTGKLFITN